MAKKKKQVSKEETSFASQTERRGPRRIIAT